VIIYRYYFDGQTDYQVPIVVNICGIRFNYYIWVIFKSVNITTVNAYCL